MGLTDIANKDIQDITTDINGWAIQITLTAPDTTTAVIKGLSTKHHMGFDTEGNPINTKNAHVSFSENELLAVEPTYPLRDADGEVDLKDTIVLVKDSTGVEKQYVIREWFPDETIGLIVCTLGDHES